MAFQAGADVAIPVGNFSKLTVQYTYLGPFFYTHYPVEVFFDDVPGADEIWELMYVNKGQNLGYPLRPNSDEILVSSSFGFGDGWDASVTAKYQRRSGQYGFNMDKYMIYRAASAGAYDDKNFNENLFEQTFGLELSIAKSLKQYPVTFSASYLYHMITARTISPTRYWIFDDPDTHANEEQATDTYVEDAYPIQYAPTGPWSSPLHSHAIRLGVNIWR